MVEIDTEGTDHPTCPYCGETYQDWWDGLPAKNVAWGIPKNGPTRGLGNAVVPQVVAQIGRAILEAENEMVGG